MNEPPDIEPPPFEQPPERPHVKTLEGLRVYSSYTGLRQLLDLSRFLALVLFILLSFVFLAGLAHGQAPVPVVVFIEAALALGSVWLGVGVAFAVLDIADTQVERWKLTPGTPG